MNVRTHRIRVAMGLGAAVAAGALALSAAPASASASSGYVSGAGSLYDDWDDEGTVSTTSKAKSNVSCLWQRVLWAEGATESNGTAYDLSDVDGVFGSNTAYATKKLQSRWGLTADGKVGKKTFTAAGNHLFDPKAVNYDSQRKYRLTYKGKSHIFYAYRSSTGKWSFYDGNAKLRYAAYGYESCS